MNTDLQQPLNEVMPAGFVYLDEFIPDLIIELAYARADNFIGEPIAGYVKPRGILTLEAATALKRAHEELHAFDMKLKIFDAYRPQQAVNQFIAWADDAQDTRMKKEFYPELEKQDLFKEGYLARKSSHSRGSALDLTLVSCYKGMPSEDLDMGTAFDFFGPASWPDYEELTPFQRANRMLLRTFLDKFGFEPHPKEWWHFALKDEPYPDTYFDFPIL